MKIKKMIALILAVLALASASTAHAQSDKTTRIEAVYTAPEIRVALPTEGKVYVNPANISINVNGEVENSQVFSEPACVENLSAMPLKVKVTVVGAVKPGSDMSLTSTSTKGAGLTSKKAFMFFDMKTANDPDGGSWTRTYNADKHIIIGTTAKSRDMVTLGPAERTGCYGAFRVSGDCVSNPKNEWTEKDGVDVSISFTFTPVPLS